MTAMSTIHAYYLTQGFERCPECGHPLRTTDDRR